MREAQDMVPLLLKAMYELLFGEGDSKQLERGVGSGAAASWKQPGRRQVDQPAVEVDELLVRAQDSDGERHWLGIKM